MAGIYNTTDGPLIIDRAGRVLGARERRDDVDVTASPVAGHIAAGRLIELEAKADAEARDDEEATPVKGKAAARRTSTPNNEEA